QALGAAHQINIVHRDLKPENIFLINRDGNPNFVKVLDFGIAKSLEEEKIRKLTTPGMAMGTPEYMAPEQASGKGSDARSDIYSLGAILYEMLTGRAPIHGENMMDILIRKATEDPVDVALLRPDVPPAVAQLVMRTLARNPEGRPQSMGELAAELNSHLADIHAGIVTVPKVPPKVPTTPPAVRLPARPAPSYSAQARYRRFLLIRGILLSGALLGVAVILYMLFFPLNPLPPRPADLAVPIGPRVTPPPPTPPDAGTQVVIAPARPDMASSGRSVEPPPSNPPPRDRRNWINGRPPAPPIERAAAFAKIQEGRQQIDSGRADLGYLQCYSATGNLQTRGSALTCMGEAEFGRGRYNEAVKLGKLALKEKGTGRDTYLLLGKTYVKQKNCKEARPLFLRVLNTSANNPEALAGLDKCPP
ncbi:MAG TPA: serine/threonine-protein kinase, partial [Pseudomonadota bacterium]|nr:serine/threonine-protein kinase [Pseudomonadota bacterium]